jgi:TolB-like protein
MGEGLHFVTAGMTLGDWLTPDRSIRVSLLSGWIPISQKSLQMVSIVGKSQFKNHTEVTRMRRYILFALVCAALLPFWGCATQAPGPVYSKDGKEYGKVRGTFRYRWWNYYERGLSYAEGEFYQEARVDFTEALRQREEDQRMARTYGMHFVDYFPHRELGIVYYETGELAAAKSELELSLSQYASSKARFYLDRVRKALMEQGAEVATPPKLALDFPTAEVWTREDPVIVSGVAEDDQYVAAVSIGGTPLFLEGAEKRISFRKEVDLPHGRHLITVRAKNLLDKNTEQQVVIHVDREGPVVTIEELKVESPGGRKEVVVTGFVYDEAGVNQLRINDREIAIDQAEEVAFIERFSADETDLVLEASDRLGNQTSAQVPVTVASKSDRPILLAWAETVATGQIALLGSGDPNPPKIELKDLTETQTVYLDKIYLQGQARDESKIESLTVNQVPILRRQGQQIFFSHMAKLQEGKNTILIEAKDEAGNLASTELAVVREIPQALQLAERLSLTVVPFEQKGEVSPASLSFQDNLIDALVNQNRFQVVERNKLDLILQEQKLSRSELVDRTTALWLGKLAAAQDIVTGSIVESRTGVEVVGRMIDTETSEILTTVDVYDEVKELKALRSLAEGMATKIHMDFPLLGGLIIQRKGNSIFTDLGQDKVSLQRRLIVYREEPIKHPVTGKILGSDNEIIGRAKVTQVLPDMSKAEVISGESGKIKPLDKVITE